MKNLKTDHEIVIDIKNGVNTDRNFSLLYERYDRYVGGAILNYTHNYETVDDLKQDVFIKVYQKLHLWKLESGDFKNWIGFIAKNVAIDSFRHNETRDLGYKTEMHNNMRSYNGYESIDHPELVKIMHRAVESSLAEHSWPERHKEAVRMVFDGHKYNQAIEGTNLNMSAMKVRMCRIRDKVAKKLQKAYQSVGSVELCQ